MVIQRRTYSEALRTQKHSGTETLEHRSTKMQFPLRPLTSSFLLLALLIVTIAGCDEDSPFESQDSVPVEVPGALSTLEFPTADGSSWEYISTDGEHTYTVRIAGTKNIGGLAARIRESDSEIPITQLGLFYGFPIRNSFFTKDLDSYTEHAFELWLATVEDTFFQRNSPKRVLWSFPLYVGKEWIVSKSLTAPEIIYTRKVVSDNNVVTVPAGTFENSYYVEEYSAFANLPTEEDLPPSKYWIAPDVGVIKYEFADPFFSVTTAYELRAFERGR